MTRAEPTQLVIDTIESILAIKSDEDEILIIDNNHSNKALYQPLAAYCNNLDASLKVRFYHKDIIDGYKAGALNLALRLMDNHCDYIVVVDSDYQALPWARHCIAKAINNYPDYALLQFPQYYRDPDKPDLHTELNHYFSHHIYRSFNRRQALSTGTFAVIKKSALLRLGGWSNDSITEDAQMGVLMHQHGLRTQYIPEVVGTGVLPDTLSDLIAQRRRWIYGNIQVLFNYSKGWWRTRRRHNTTISATDANPLSSPLPQYALSKGHADSASDSNGLLIDNQGSYKMVLAHLSQLTAWVNFTGGFILLHSLCVLLLLVSQLGGFLAIDTLSVNMLSACYVSYAVFLIRRLWAYLKDSKPLLKPEADHPPLTSLYAPKDISQQSKPSTQLTPKVPIKTRLRGWLIHLNFWELGALSWLPVLWGRKKPFVCTPKSSLIHHPKRKTITMVKAAPKFLIYLNILTAVLILQYSGVLALCAISIVLLKLVASWLLVDNFTTDTAQHPSIDLECPYQCEALEAVATVSMPHRPLYQPKSKDKQENVKDVSAVA